MSVCYIKSDIGFKLLANHQALLFITVFQVLQNWGCNNVTQNMLIFLFS